MAKKIGILTFHTSLNYGAILQAVALQKKMLDLGIDAEIIDYENKVFRERYGFLKYADKKNIVERVGLVIVKNLMRMPIRNKYKKFISQVDLSSQKYDENSIVSAKYDRVFVGSDQVWNMNLTGNDAHYFLDFMPQEKISSYAASFGFSELPNNLSKEEYSNLLKRFETPSLRESSGVDLYTNLTGKKASSHVDPTLLFTGEEWANKFNLKKKKGKEYILVYTVALPEKLTEHIKEVAARNNMEVIEITPRIMKKDKSFHAKRFCGPEDFLNLIYNASIVATTSFHASVFATLFHKPLMVELTDAKGIRNVRIESLLNLVGVDVTKETSMVDVFDMDYNLSEINLKASRDEACEYLKKESEK